jgi:hypothetical protein
VSATSRVELPRSSTGLRSPTPAASISQRRSDSRSRCKMPTPRIATRILTAGRRLAGGGGQAVPPSTRVSQLVPARL